MIKPSLMKPKVVSFSLYEPAFMTFSSSILLTDLVLFLRVSFFDARQRLRSRTCPSGPAGQFEPSNPECPLNTNVAGSGLAQDDEAIIMHISALVFHEVEVLVIGLSSFRPLCEKNQ